jgi:serine/threonine protein kinase
MRPIESDFQVVRVLDSGSFASVQLGWAKVEVGVHSGGKLRFLKKLDKVAIKSYNKQKVKEGAESGAMRHMKQDCALVGAIVMDHPHLLGPWLRYETVDHVHLVMEYASKGSLHEYIRKAAGGPLREHRVRPIMKQITSAVAHMHAHGLCHRDLKLEKCVITGFGYGSATAAGGSGAGTGTGSDAQKAPVVKLIDFGLAGRGGCDECNTLCGSPQYMAPELVMKMLNEQPQSQSRQQRQQETARGETAAHPATAGAVSEVKATYSGKLVDMWSLGVLLYALLSAGQYPFSSSTLGGIWNNIKRGSFNTPQHFSSQARELLRGLLKVQPDSRFTVGDAEGSAFLLGK